MINYYWGNDREKVRKAARAALSARRENSPEAPVIELTGEETSIENLREAFYSRPLSGGGTIVFLDHLTVNPVLTDFVADNLPILISSDNVFIFREDETMPSLAAAVALAGGSAEEFRPSSGVEVSSPETKKLFVLADALGWRDRQRAWLLYHDARRSDLSAEDIFWKFAWKVKTLLLVATASGGAILPLKPYPLAQARRQVGKYKVGELAKLSSRLVRLYHDARRGLADLDLALERLILEM